MSATLLSCRAPNSDPIAHVDHVDRDCNRNRSIVLLNLIGTIDRVPNNRRLSIDFITIDGKIAIELDFLSISRLNSRIAIGTIDRDTLNDRSTNSEPCSFLDDVRLLQFTVGSKKNTCSICFQKNSVLLKPGLP